MTAEGRTPWGLILALWGAGLGAAAQYGKVSVVFDALPEIFPEAGAAVGWAVSLVGLVGIVFGVVAGLLVARVRYRRALLWGLWLGAAMSLVQALPLSFGWFLVARAVEGLSHLALVVAAPTLIAALSAPKDRGLTLTLWGTFFGVAFAVLAWGGVPLADWLGVRMLFAAHGVYLIVFALILGATLRALPEEGPVAEVSLTSVLRDHIEIYRSPHLAAAAAGWLFYTFSFVSILTVLPPYLEEGIRGMVMGAMPLMSIVVSMTLGVWMLGRMTAVRVVEIGFLTSLVALVWLWVAEGDPVAALVLAGTLGLIQGATFAVVPELNTGAAHQARANGAMAQMGNLGNTLGTPVMAAALLWMGYTALPLLAGLAMIAGFALHLWLGHMRRR